MVQEVQVSVHEENGITIVDLRGRVDASSSGEVDTALSSLIDSGVRKIVLNAEGLLYISSSGLRILLSSLKKVRKDGGDLILSGLMPAPMEVVTMTGFNRIFKICPDTREALGQFS